MKKAHCTVSIVLSNLHICIWQEKEENKRNGGERKWKVAVEFHFLMQAVVSPYAELSKSFTHEIILDPKCLIIYINGKGILSQTL